jgi:hypothetical protein
VGPGRDASTHGSARRRAPWAPRGGRRPGGYGRLVATGRLGGIDTCRDGWGC